LAYKDLVFTAAIVGLMKINDKKEMKHIAGAAQSYQEKTLNRTMRQPSKDLPFTRGLKVFVRQITGIETKEYPEVFSSMEIDIQLTRYY
jgi:hypothetical protein